jgi:hypothetical protein
MTTTEASWFAKMNGEWDPDRDPSEWVAGDPLPGRSREDFSNEMFCVLEVDAICLQYPDKDGVCWCQFPVDPDGDYREPRFAPGISYRWSPRLPEEMEPHLVW